MNQNLTLLQSDPQPEYVERALQLCNQHTEADRLVLCREDIVGLIKYRNDTLREERRVEFGEGPLIELVAAFHNFPFLVQADYVDTLASLQSGFYHLKEVTEESISDTDLIDAMRVYCDNTQGTADLFGEDTAFEIRRIAQSLNKDQDEEFSEEENFRFDTQSTQSEPEANRSEIDRIVEGGRHYRPDNEYANSFYEGFNELYRSGWDFNSRIGGSNL